MIRSQSPGPIKLSVTALAAVLMGAFALGLWTARHTRADEPGRPPGNLAAPAR
jgi:hypothetical protein